MTEVTLVHFTAVSPSIQVYMCRGRAVRSLSSIAQGWYCVAM